MTQAGRGVGDRFGADLIGGLLIAGAAEALWEAVRVITARRIAMERVALELDLWGDGETEGAGARLGTLLSLVRASGGVGLAIDFGARTLVKETVSGVFILIDDACRLGELIDVGDVKGTVELISVRSMQLRRRRGVPNTTPFGDIGHVANFSRDWVVATFPLRLPCGADAEKVRKLVKKPGHELLEHPELGDQFRQPLKCQGVAQMEDSAMIMPVKFMSRPGEQRMLRPPVPTRVHGLFEDKTSRTSPSPAICRPCRAVPASGQREVREVPAGGGSGGTTTLPLA